MRAEHYVRTAKTPQSLPFHSLESELRSLGQNLLAFASVAACTRKDMYTMLGTRAARKSQHGRARLETLAKHLLLLLNC